MSAPRPRPRSFALGRTLLLSLSLLAIAWAVAPPAGAAPDSGPAYGQDTKVGIDEHLGATIPMDVTFLDEDGHDVRLGSLLHRPTILTLVYFRCPGICSPLLHELARTVDEVKDLVPGIDYDLVTVSFDDREGPELARRAKSNLLGEMKTKVPPESWHFLTGTAPQIMRLANAVGFRFRKDKEDFVHAGTVIFLTKGGEIVRYLGGLKLLPMDVQMAVLDAAKGRPRTLMQRIQQLCYAYDPKGKTYVLMVNRIILGVSIVLVILFLVYLLIKRRRDAHGAQLEGPIPTPAQGSDQ